jgi:hypothetical protein
MIKYEFVKIFRKKSIIIALIIFSIINVYKINIYFQHNGRVDNEFNQGYWTVHNKVSGTIDEDKINFIKNRYKNARAIVSSGNYSTKPNQPNTYTGYIFGDMNMFKEIFNSLGYFYNYRESINSVILKATENIDFYKEHGNAYEVKNNHKILNVYGERSISEFYNTEGYEYFFRYNFSSLMIILLLLLGLSSVFSREKASSMHIILSTCKYGRGKTVLAKLIASMLYTTIISLCFFVLDFICFLHIFKLIGHNLPIYAIESFEFTPFNYKMWQFVIFFDVVKLLTFITIAGIIIFFSSVFEESILPFIISAGTIIFCLSCNDFLSNNAQNMISLINPVSLLTDRTVFMKYTVVNICGQPVFKYIVMFAINIFYIMFILLAVLIFNRKNIYLSRIKLISFFKSIRKWMPNI